MSEERDRECVSRRERGTHRGGSDRDGGRTTDGERNKRRMNAEGGHEEVEQENARTGGPYRKTKREGKPGTQCPAPARGTESRFPTENTGIGTRHPAAAPGRQHLSPGSGTVQTPYVTRQAPSGQPPPATRGARCVGTRERGPAPGTRDTAPALGHPAPDPRSSTTSSIAAAPAAPPAARAPKPRAAPASTAAAALGAARTTPPAREQPRDRPPTRRSRSSMLGLLQ